jgi:hypothetical protein
MKKIWEEVSFFFGKYFLQLGAIQGYYVFLVITELNHRHLLLLNLQTLAL